MSFQACQVQAFLLLLNRSGIAQAAERCYNVTVAGVAEWQTQGI